jgi:hypothetical protein
MRISIKTFMCLFSLRRPSVGYTLPLSVAVFLVLLWTRLQQVAGAPDPTLAPLSWTLVFVPLHIAHLALVLPVALWLTGRAVAPRSSEELHRCHRDERALFLSDSAADSDDDNDDDDHETAGGIEGGSGGTGSIGGQDGTVAYSVVADLGPGPGVGGVGAGGAAWSPQRKPMSGGPARTSAPRSQSKVERKY